jgi:hypothetical protein
VGNTTNPVGESVESTPGRSTLTVGRVLLALVLVLGLLSALFVGLPMLLMHLVGFQPPTTETFWMSIGAIDVFLLLVIGSAGRGSSGLFSLLLLREASRS